MSVESVNVFLKFFSSLHPKSEVPACLKSCLRTIASHCNITQQLKSGQMIYRLNLIFQIKMIMKNNLSAFLDFRRQLLSNGNVDVISTSPHVVDTEPYVIHAMLCADGTSIFKTKSVSFWPLQLILLDFPLHIRQKIHNRILYILCLTKPKWSDVLSNVHEDFDQSFSLTVNRVTYNFKLKLFKCIFDLPGLASICNVTQYNGAYGCPFCLHPGEQISVGHGSSRKYPLLSNVPLRTDEHYRECLCSLQESGKIFGVKGHSPLFQSLKYPDDIVFDSMHAFFEGVAKQYLMFSTTHSVSRHPLKFDSRSKRKFLDDFLLSIAVPHDFSKFPSLEHLRMFTASEFKKILIYLFVPIYLSVTPLVVSEHILLLVYIIRLSFSTCIDSDTCSFISKLVSVFLSKADTLLPKDFFTLNFHFFCHLEKQLRTSGPLQGCSMFAFEAGMKHLKKLSQGTTHQGKQIVENFLLYKYVYFEASSKQSDYSVFENVLNDLGIRAETEDGYISANRYRRKGIVYHSINYERKGKSQSFLCFLESGELAEIISFKKGDPDHVLVKIFPNRSLLSYFSQKLFREDPYVNQLIADVDTFLTIPFFNVTDEQSSRTATIPISSILCKALRMKCFLLDENVFLTTPVLQTGESN